MNMSFRPLEDSDISLMAEWLNKDYVIKWYNDPNEWLEEINSRNDKFNWIHHFIVLDEKTPIGFCQYYDCFNANDIEDWYGYHLIINMVIMQCTKRIDIGENQ